MNKETLQKHYNFLREAYNDFSTNKAGYQQGEVSRTMESAVKDVESYVNQEPELHSLLTSGESAIKLDELKTEQHFARDMVKVLIKIENLINEEEDD